MKKSVKSVHGKRGVFYFEREKLDTQGYSRLKE